MATQERLSQKLQSFPSESHVDDVCKKGQGAATCRYLMYSSNGFVCGKNGEMRELVDRRAREGTMTAQSDNCEGVLGVLIENKDQLTGNKIVYRETMPTIETSGTLMDIRVQKDATRLDITWEDGRVDYLSWSNDNLLLKVLPGSVSFEVNGIGAFGGIAKVYLNKETR